MKYCEKIDPGIRVWRCCFFSVRSLFFFYFGLVSHYTECKVGRITTNSKISCKYRKVKDEKTPAILQRNEGKRRRQEKKLINLDVNYELITSLL